MEGRRDGKSSEYHFWGKSCKGGDDSVCECPGDQKYFAFSPLGPSLSLFLFSCMYLILEPSPRPSHHTLLSITLRTVRYLSLRECAWTKNKKITQTCTTGRE